MPADRIVSSRQDSVGDVVVSPRREDASPCRCFSFAQGRFAGRSIDRPGQGSVEKRQEEEIGTPVARPHIDFVQAQALSWDEGRYPAIPGVKSKTLSTDHDTGACTVILRYPPGWRAAGAGYFACDVEVYVLDGAFAVNGRTFGLDCYGYWPAGFVQEDAASQHGCDVLAFIDGAPHVTHGAPPAGKFDQSRAVPFLDTHEMAWSKEGLDPDYTWFGFQWKVLRHNERTQATTFLLDTPAQRHPPGWMARDEVHTCTEEIMILSGELCTPYGVLHAGA
ncbi:MAG: DUF4437 domain-containing protein, partial [Alphaproteobacteria bacterium]|nr:DUF4437 domain-containing protein [Alphaproteobacteria bacterium]